jgi:hypothetical protein
MHELIDRIIWAALAILVWEGTADLIQWSVTP